MALGKALLLAAGLIPALSHAAPALHERQFNNSTCKKTTVAIIGGGIAGMTAAQALANQSVTDFLILEYTDTIGGRMHNTKFGADSEGNPYTLELGPNWVSGLGENTNGPENPVWTFAKQANLTTPYSDTGNVTTYTDEGMVDYTDVIDEFNEYWGMFEQDAGTILTENLQDKSFAAGMWQSGWRAGTAIRRAVEYWLVDWGMAQTPEESSLVYGITASNYTYYGFSEEDTMCLDQRGFNYWLKHQASKFLQPNDPRLMLNTIVTNITYSDSGVTITNEDGSCVEADYAINTVSLGVLQNNAITFSPALPSWKEDAIASFQIGTYTKIFYQFNSTWWPTDQQYMLYADPTTKGYYAVWQSLSLENFLPGSNILFATLVDEQSYRIEAQDDEVTKKEGLEVLQKMFPNVTIPEPTAFMYPRWTKTPWAYGSYSNWPAGTTLEMHQNLRANVGRLYFAGEATSAMYYGYLHGAWFEGREAGQRIAGQITGECVNLGSGCGDYVRYEVLHGSTGFKEYDAENGMWRSPFFASEGGGVDHEEE